MESITSKLNKDHTQRKGKWKLFLGLLALLVAIRIVLPYVLLKVANKRLMNMPEYYGHIEDLDLSLLRGAYTLDEFFLDNLDSLSKERTPFIGAKKIDLSVEWRALFHGFVVGELVIDEPFLRFTLGKTEPAEVQKDTASLGDLLKDFMPLKINSLELRNGRLEYSDEGSSPPLDLAITQLNALATNLNSVVLKEELLPSKVKATAEVYDGALEFNMALDPLARQTIFDMDVSLEGMTLKKLNDMFNAYANFDVNSGTMGLYTEIATRNGEFTGYIKPVIKDLDVLGKENRHDGFFHKIYEGLVGTAGVILRNRKEEQVATKVPLQGKLDSPDIKTWAAVIQILRNAFVRALEPAIDRDVNINTPLDQDTDEKKGVLKKVFGNEAKKEKDRGKK